MASSSDLIKDIVKDLTQEGTQALDLPTVVGLIVSPAAGTLAATAAVTGVKKAQKALSPSSDQLHSNHELLAIIHQCRWQALAIIIEEILQNPGAQSPPINKSFLRNLQGDAVYQQNQPPAHQLDPRSENHTKASGRLQRLLKHLTPQILREQETPAAPTAISEAERNLLQNIELFLTRPTNNRPEILNQLRQDLAQQCLQASAELTLDQLYFIKHRNYSDPGHKFNQLAQTDPTLALFLTRYRDTERGWIATFLCLLQQMLTQGKTANKLLLQLGADNLTLALEAKALAAEHSARLQEIATAQQEHSQQLNQVQKQLQQVLAQVTQTLRLSPTGADVKAAGSYAFIDYTYTSKKSGFFGRGQEFGQLWAYLHGEQPLAWWQIAGDGGQGKSRLALELVEQAQQAGWHAGFLRNIDTADLDWSRVTLAPQTLCVVDYIADPIKAQSIANAIAQLEQRLNDSQAPHPLPTSHKIRILIVERSPFALNPSQVHGIANWFNTFLRAGNQQTLRATVWQTDSEATPLILNDLQPEDMRNIARAWRRERQKTPLTPKQEDQLIEFIAHGQRKRRWRPLLAMAATDQIASSPTGQSPPGFNEVFDFVLEEEQHQWRQDLQGVNLPAEPCRLAILATLTGTLDISQQELDSTFYGLERRHTLEQTWNILGFDYTPHRKHTPALTARTPDLLGEYLIDWLDRGDDLPIIVNDAWQLNPGETYQCLWRIMEDADDLQIHDCAGKLLSVKPTESSTSLWPTLFILAAAQGLDKAINAMLPEVDINWVEPSSGLFPLLMAAIGNHTQVIEQLLKQPDIEANKQHPTDGAFPLLLAAENGHTLVVEQLLKQPHIEVNKTHPTDGNFPLIMAAKNGHTQVVEQLLKQPHIEVNKTHPDGFFPLLQAAQNGHTQVVEQLLNQPHIEVNKTDPTDGTFPLLMAAQKGHIQVVEQLLKQPDIEVNKQRPSDGAFPLLLAAVQGFIEVVKLLAKANADLTQIL